MPSRSSMATQYNSRDAELHLIQATYENGVVSSYGYDAATGRLTSFASTHAGTTLQSLAYRYDVLGNLIERNDTYNALDETYSYDELNRLTQIGLPGGRVENSFAYDVLGNMLSKADVGTYTYPAAGSPQPHAVASIAYSAVAGGGTSFTYGDNGNLLAGAGRTVSWSLFNMPAGVTYGASTVNFQYDADHNRVAQIAPEGTTYYLPDGKAFVASSGATTWHSYIELDGERIGEFYGPVGALHHHFFHDDYQNSVGTVTDDRRCRGAEFGLRRVRPATQRQWGSGPQLGGQRGDQAGVYQPGAPDRCAVDRMLDRSCAQRCRHEK